MRLLRLVHQEESVGCKTLTSGGLLIQTLYLHLKEQIKNVDVLGLGHVVGLMWRCSDVCIVVYLGVKEYALSVMQIGPLRTRCIFLVADYMSVSIFLIIMVHGLAHTVLRMRK